MSKIDQYTNEEFINIINTSCSFSECCRKIGYSDKGRYGTDKIKKRCKDLNVSTEHFAFVKSNGTKKYTLDEILIKDSFYQNISRLKIRLINEKRLEYKCAICGNQGEWNGIPLTLELDHINGQHLDHRIENLRFLCPNCHSQTNTNSGKNKNKTTSC